jgi:tetratricopeptide (TPR) repeat protein
LNNGNLLLNLRDKDNTHGAELLLEKSVEINPTPDNLYNLANCCYSLKKTDSALKYWKQSANIKPSSDVYVNIANIYTIDKKPALAIENYRKALELSPKDGEIHYNFAATLEFDSQFEAAIKHYQEAIDLGIDKEAVTKNLLNVHAKLAGKKMMA